MSRPELTGPPELFYNATEARKYTQNSRIQLIQKQLSERAVELLNLPAGRKALILDVGCGSGLSGDVLEEAGHEWVGVDISGDMLETAVEGEASGDLVQRDMGHGMPFRSAMFDGVISISALQWLCNADRSEHKPRKRLQRFFNTLYKCIVRGGRAVFQLYPSDDHQLSMITGAALRCGFSGGVVVDYPNSTKARKFFLCLFAGTPDQYEMPTPKTGEPEPDAQQLADRQQQRRRRGVPDRRNFKKGKEWVLNKKERQRLQGKDVRPDSKYTARRRKPKF